VTFVRQGGPLGLTAPATYIRVPWAPKLASRDWQMNLRLTVPGLINRDFADVRAVMKDAGSALMGIARASGENRAVEAAHQAIASPLLELDIHGAQGILWNITGSSNLSLFEVNEAAEAIKEAADPEAMIMFGTSFNERLADEVMVTVIATGFDGGKRRPSLHREVGVMEGAASSRISHERDFLQELERQREQGGDGAFGPGIHEDDAAAIVSSPRVERAAGENAARRTVTYDADDLEIPSFLRRK